MEGHVQQRNNEFLREESLKELRKVEDELVNAKEACEKAEKRLHDHPDEETRKNLLYELQKQRLLYSRFHAQRVELLRKLTHTGLQEAERPTSTSWTSDSAASLTRRLVGPPNISTTYEHAFESNITHSGGQDAEESLASAKPPYSGTRGGCDTLANAGSFFTRPSPSPFGGAASMEGGEESFDHREETTMGHKIDEVMLIGTGAEGSTANATLERNERIVDQRQKIGDLQLRFIHEHTRFYRLETVLNLEPTASTQRSEKGAMKEEVDLGGTEPGGRKEAWAGKSYALKERGLDTTLQVEMLRRTFGEETLAELPRPIIEAVPVVQGKDDDTAGNSEEGTLLEVGLRHSTMDVPHGQNVQSRGVSPQHPENISADSALSAMHEAQAREASKDSSVSHSQKAKSGASSHTPEPTAPERLPPAGDHPSKNVVESERITFDLQLEESVDRKKRRSGTTAGALGSGVVSLGSDDDNHQSPNDIFSAPGSEKVIGVDEEEGIVDSAASLPQNISSESQMVPSLQIGTSTLHDDESFDVEMGATYTKEQPALVASSGVVQPLVESPILNREEMEWIELDRTEVPLVAASELNDGGRGATDTPVQRGEVLVDKAIAEQGEISSSRMVAEGLREASHLDDSGAPDTSTSSIEELPRGDASPTPDQQLEGAPMDSTRMSPSSESTFIEYGEDGDKGREEELTDAEGSYSPSTLHLQPLAEAELIQSSYDQACWSPVELQPIQEEEYGDEPLLVEHTSSTASRNGERQQRPGNGENKGSQQTLSPNGAIAVDPFGEYCEALATGVALESSQSASQLTTTKHEEYGTHIDPIYEERIVQVGMTPKERTPEPAKQPQHDKFDVAVQVQPNYTEAVQVPDVKGALRSPTDDERYYRSIGIHVSPLYAEQGVQVPPLGSLVQFPSIGTPSRRRTEIVFHQATALPMQMSSGVQVRSLLTNAPRQALPSAVGPQEHNSRRSDTRYHSSADLSVPKVELVRSHSGDIVEHSQPYERRLRIVEEREHSLSEELGSGIDSTLRAAHPQVTPYMPRKTDVQHAEGPHKIAEELRDRGHPLVSQPTTPSAFKEPTQVSGERKLHHRLGESPEVRLTAEPRKLVSPSFYGELPFDRLLYSEAGWQMPYFLVAKGFELLAQRWPIRERVLPPLFLTAALAVLYPPRRYSYNYTRSYSWDARLVDRDELDADTEPELNGWEKLPGPKEEEEDELQPIELRTFREPLFAVAKAEQLGGEGTAALHSANSEWHKAKRNLKQVRIQEERVPSKRVRLEEKEELGAEFEFHDPYVRSASALFELLDREYSKEKEEALLENREPPLTLRFAQPAKLTATGGRKYPTMPELQDGLLHLPHNGDGISSLDSLHLSGAESERCNKWDPTKLLAEKLYRVDWKPLVEKRSRFRNMEGHLEVPNHDSNIVPTVEPEWRKLYFRTAMGRFQWFASHCADECPIEDVLLTGTTITANRDDWTVEVRGGRENANLKVRVPSSCWDKWLQALLSHSNSKLIDAYVQPVFPPVPHYTDRVVLVDLGTCSLRAGLLTNRPSLPQSFFPSVGCVSEPNGEVRHVGVEAFAAKVRQQGHLQSPIQSANSANPLERYKLHKGVMEACLRKVLADFGVDSTQYRVLVSIPQGIPTVWVGEMLRMLINQLHFKAASIARHPSLVLYSYDVTTGVVVDIGERLNIVPVIDEFIVESGAISLPFGAQQIRENLKQRLSSKIPSFAQFNSAVEELLLRYMVEQACYVGTDYDEEKAKQGAGPVEVHFDQLNIGPQMERTVVVDSTSRYEATEGLFQPKKWGLDMKGIHQLVHEAIQLSPIDSRRTLYRNVYLAGGTSLLPGLAERLETELCKIAPSSIFVQVHGSPWRYNAAYVGAQVLAGSHQFEACCANAANLEKYIKQMEVGSN